MRKHRKIKTGMVEHPDVQERTGDVLIHAFLIVCMFICIIPLWHTLMASLSDGQMLAAHSGVLWKWLTADGKPNWAGYLKTVQYSDMAVLKSYAITLGYVVANVACGLLINIIGAYVLYRRPKAAPFLSIFFLISMMFSGGTVPTYMVIHKLKMTNTALSLILPGCTNAMFLFMVFNGFKQVPESTIEAAELDGAGHFTIMFQVLLPQSWGITIVTMINQAIITWNSWFEASIYVTSSKKLWPLQLWIRQLVADNSDIMSTSMPDWDKYLVPYCVIIIATVPVLLAMPFVQKQLQKGALVGGVKG